MWNLYDIAYSIGLTVSAPVWLSSAEKRAKVQTALHSRMGFEIPKRTDDAPCILIHAVSVGEMNATRPLVQKLREAKPNLRFVISTTTETGYTRGVELYPPAADVAIIRYPLDFSSAINRMLDAVRPDVVVLMELEVWPNMVLRCKQRGIPVILANARLTDSSFRNYRWGGPVIRTMFKRLTCICAQDMTYAQRFVQLGVPEYRIVITGTVKFDNISFAPPLPAALHRAQMLGLRIGEDPIWVCGSTGPGEEAMVLRIYRNLLRKFARLRLVIVPRHPPRFDEVAQIIEQHQLNCVRLSHMNRAGFNRETVLSPVVLIDTMGILRDFYSIATVVFVGRSMVDLGPRQHGSDMIEPAALGKPTVIGPFTTNFAEAVRKFLEADAMIQVGAEADLEQAISVLLSTPAEAMAMGRRAQDVVKHEQGATQRHVRVIIQVLQTKLDEEFNPAALAEAIKDPEPPARERPWNPVQMTPPPATPGFTAPPPPSAPLPLPDVEPPPPKKSTRVIITSISPIPDARVKPPGE